jgi:hypothetical protein
VSVEIEMQKNILNVSGEQIEFDFSSLLEEIGDESIGLKDKILDILIPKT